MTIDENLSKLAEVMAEMEQGKLPLEEALAKYEEGIRLVKECQEMIDKTEKRIQMIEAQNDDI